MKEWPEDGGTASFGDIVEPLREAVDHLYALERKPLADKGGTQCQ